MPIESHPRLDRIYANAERFERNHVRDGFYVENQNREDGNGDAIEHLPPTAAT